MTPSAKSPSSLQVAKKKKEDPKWSWDLAFGVLVRVVLGLIMLAVAQVLGMWIQSVVQATVVRQSRRRRLLLSKESHVPLSMFRSRNRIASIAGWLLYVLVMLVALLLVLRLLGMQIATIVAGLTFLGFLVGFAAQGSMNDMAAGVMLALFQVYDVGDVVYIEGSPPLMGRVVDFHVLNTLLQDLDKLTLVTVPNSTIQRAVVENFSRTNYHYYVVGVRLASDGQANDFEALMEGIVAELNDAALHPEIMHVPGLHVDAHIQDLSQPATIVQVRVPMSPSGDVRAKRAAVRDGVRRALTLHKAKMWPVRS